MSVTGSFFNCTRWFKKNYSQHASNLNGISSLQFEPSDDWLLRQCMHVCEVCMSKVLDSKPFLPSFSAYPCLPCMLLSMFPFFLVYSFVYVNLFTDCSGAWLLSFLQLKLYNSAHVTQAGTYPQSRLHFAQPSLRLLKQTTEQRLRCTARYVGKVGLPLPHGSQRVEFNSVWNQLQWRQHWFEWGKGVQEIIEDLIMSASQRGSKSFEKNTMPWWVTRLIGGISLHVSSLI